MRSAAAALVLIAALVAPLSIAHAEVRAITFPVGGTFSFRNDFGEPRSGGTRAHQGIDIVAAKMTPAVAAVDGVVTFMAIPQASWGYSITIRDADGYSYRYLHLNNDTPGTDDGQGGETNAYAPGITRGSTVTKGQVIGWVGDSGNAESTVSHLHFEIHNGSGPINPYDSLYAAAGGTGTGTFTTPSVQGTEGSIQEEEQFVIRRQLQEGMVDRDVQGLHQELTTLGLYTGPISEAYTSETREAVRRFQASKKITPSGIADAETRKALMIALKTQPVQAVPASTGASGLSLGASGEAVRALQQKLNDLGLLKAAPTGYFGTLTEAAVKAFQTANGIEPLGFVGPKTKAALEAARPGGMESESAVGLIFKTDLVEGMRSEEVRELQKVLAMKGHFPYDPTGYYGTLTKAAVIAFQNANGIEPIGIVGPKTRAALNAE